MFNIDIETIAKTCHEVNRVFCKSIGDNSQVEWKDTPEWLKKSCIMNVKNIIKNPDMTPEWIHETWVAEKVQEGWSYGLVKDVVNKKHPSILPYSKLPQNEKYKDELFLSIVKSVTST